MIYHIAHDSSLNKALQTGTYEHPSLEKEGFIHTCSYAQISDVRKRYYEGIDKLTLLHIDESLVSANIKYETAPSVNEVFPHIYGPLNMEAVVKAEII